MTKSKKLLMLAGVLAVLVVAYVAVTALIGEETPNLPDDNGNEETPTYTIFSLNINNLVAFSYTVEGKEYAYTLAEDATGWSWDDDTTLPISNGQVTLMMKAMVSLTSQYRLENVPSASLLDYGLGENAAWVKFTYADGTADQLLFGKLNSYNGLVYCALNSDLSTVYMVEASLPDTFAVTPDRIVENDTLPLYKQDRFSGFKLEWNGVTYAAEYAYLSESPAEDEEKEITLYAGSNGEGRVLDAEVREALIAEFLGWKLKDALTFHPAKYEEYGVTDGAENTLSVYYTYTLEYKDETTGTTNSSQMQGIYTLLLGKMQEDGTLCVRLSDGKGVYTLDMATLLSLAIE